MDLTLTKGKSLLMPTVAARAVLPTPGGPSSKHVISGVLSLCRTCEAAVSRLRTPAPNW